MTVVAHGAAGPWDELVFLLCPLLIVAALVIAGRRRPPPPDGTDRPEP